MTGACAISHSSDGAPTCPR